MRARLTDPTVRERLAEYPAVALVGARQSGKTTLAKAIGGRYYDLEQEADRLRLDRAADLVGAERRFLVSQTGRTAGDEHRASLDLPGLLALLQRGRGS